ncbi:hypothetical protein [Saccharopolyspora dendranthemae]|uniref:IrrE N-terminal-like domain-containing protein n=1 Tax=Saccharopolyspora dendranthemae TaxID=1181886 RepID=A0A561U5I7_9PSEU|nr:hypothetical protein [Saccharopolyspora dendranthemae]TWF94616.1 hypothetical protein FHU35_13331 [Saccharopolyspora dendranthemae]
MSHDHDPDPMPTSFRCARLVIDVRPGHDDTPDDRSQRDMTARCHELAGALPLPTPWDLRTFIAELSEARGRPIELRQVSTVESESPCGALISLSDRDVIGYVPSTPLHEEHIILHEVGHLVCGHSDTKLADSPMVAALVPDLSPELIRSVLGRSPSAFDAAAEQQAELVASLYLYRAGRAPAPPRRVRKQAAPGRTLREIQATFDSARRRGPEKR